MAVVVALAEALESTGGHAFGEFVRRMITIFYYYKCKKVHKSRRSSYTKKRKNFFEEQILKHQFCFIAYIAAVVRYLISDYDRVHICIRSSANPHVYVFNLCLRKCFAVFIV